MTGGIHLSGGLGEGGVCEVGRVEGVERGYMSKSRL